MTFALQAVTTNYLAHAERSFCSKIILPLSLLPLPPFVMDGNENNLPILISTIHAITIRNVFCSLTAAGLTDIAHPQRCPRSQDHAAHHREGQRQRMSRQRAINRPHHRHEQAQRHIGQ